MRISDWSSDVCSSDLSGSRICRKVLSEIFRRPMLRPWLLVSIKTMRVDFSSREGWCNCCLKILDSQICFPDVASSNTILFWFEGLIFTATILVPSAEIAGANRRLRRRSEEHTSELQSLMRHSY